MKITLLKRSNKKLSEFKRAEWVKIHPEHFGTKHNKHFWDAKKVRLKAEDKGKIVGALVGTIMAGVFHIEELMVDHSLRGKGIGKKLLNNSVELAKENSVHVLYLETGEDWKSLSFYEKLGFKKETLLKNFYEHKNFWLMTKEI